MKIVKIIGGLGNQMFQYALAIALKKNSKKKMGLDILCLKVYRKYKIFEIGKVFGIKLYLA